jgi:hypothetical protein
MNKRETLAAADDNLFESSAFFQSAELIQVNRAEIRVVFSA